MAFFACLLAVGTLSLHAEDQESAARNWGGLSFEAGAGTEGIIASCLWAVPETDFEIALRGGLGYESADFTFNDPLAALAFRWTPLEAGRWKFGGSLEAGAVRIDNGYEKLFLPYGAGTALTEFTIGKGFSLSAEAGARYGKGTQEHRKSLELFDVSFRETLYLSPLVLRLGLKYTL